MSLKLIKVIQSYLLNKDYLNIIVIFQKKKILKNINIIFLKLLFNKKTFNFTNCIINFIYRI